MITWVPTVRRRLPPNEDGRRVSANKEFSSSLFIERALFLKRSLFSVYVAQDSLTTGGRCQTGGEALLLNGELARLVNDRKLWSSSPSCCVDEAVSIFELDGMLSR